jgi:hypothetical protein
MADKRSRVTLRKRYINEVFYDEYRGRPVLLEEFRWRVFLLENATEGRDQTMSLSYKKSFGRTLREHMPCLGVFKFQRSDKVPVVLLVRSAAFRCDNTKTASEFFSSKSLCIYIDTKGRRVLDYSEKLTVLPYIIVDRDSPAKAVFDVRKMFYIWFCVNTTENYESEAIHRECVPFNNRICFVSELYKGVDLNCLCDFSWKSCRFFRVIAQGINREARPTVPIVKDIAPYKLVTTPRFFDELAHEYIKKHDQTLDINEAIRHVVRHHLFNILVQPKTI